MDAQLAGARETSSKQTAWAHLQVERGACWTFIWGIGKVGGRNNAWDDLRGICFLFRDASDVGEWFHASTFKVQLEMDEAKFVYRTDFTQLEVLPLLTDGIPSD